MQVTTRCFSRHPRLAAAAVLLAFAAGLTGASAMEQDSKSAIAARALAAALDTAKLDSIAAPDPASPGTWIAALYFKDAQLLVVSAQYAAPVLLEEKAKAKQYRDIYIDLNSASVAGTKVFVQDMLADGLLFEPQNDGAADSWEEKDKILAFDGDWKQAKLSEEQYQKTFTDADARYAQMLSLLTAHAKPKTGSLRP